MKRIALFFLGFLLVNQIFAQSAYFIAREKGFEYLAVKDTFRYSTNDSIKFVVSNVHDNKPFLLFIQGSGNASLFEKMDKHKVYCIFEDLIPDSIKSAYRIVLISKPGVPLVTDSTKSNKFFFLESRGDFMKFIQNNFLDYYVSSAKQVIDYLKNTDPFHANIFVVGHSQGYQVVAKLAADFPTNITKAVCMSSNPFGQSYVENIQKIRQDELSGRISALSSQNQIDSIYKSFLQNMKGYQYYKVPELSENYSYYRTDYSFNCKLAIDDLVRIKCPVLVVYGSADITSINNDLLPFFFARSGKDNLTLHCYPGYTHNYYIKLGNGKYSERSNWQKVFIDIDMWLKSNQ